MSECRVIKTTGAPNLRDLGGYDTADGKRVKWGLVFRSDDLNDLTAADVKVLAGLGIRTVVDFRDRDEVQASPDNLPETVQRRVNIPIEAGRLMGGFASGKLTRNKSFGIMVSVYRALANDFQDSFREFFELLADPERLPLLFHCTAGKDRTGLAAALFLSALGVDRATVIQDYLLSRECLKTKYIAGIDYDSIMEPLFSVSPEYIGAAFEVIDGRYGGVESYLTRQLGVDLPRFREMFTEFRSASPRKPS